MEAFRRNLHALWIEGAFRVIVNGRRVLGGRCSPNHKSFSEGGVMSRLIGSFLELILSSSSLVL